MLDHYIEVEDAMGAVAELHSLVDVVFDWPGEEGHAAIDCEVDWHRD